MEENVSGCFFSEHSVYKKLVRLALALFSVSSLKDEKLIKNANLHEN